MKSLIKKSITLIYKSTFGLKKNLGIRALAYHSIVNKDTKDLWSLNLDIFKDHITFFKKNKIISSDSLINQKLDQGILITFDDGYKNNLEYVEPLLTNYKIPFTIFVVTDYIKNKNNNYLNENELKKIAKNSLVTIASHSKTHPRLTNCNDKDLKKEVFDSKKYLEDLLGKKTELFSYPHGMFDQRVIIQVKKARYKLAFTSHYDVIKPKDDRFTLNRNEIWNTDNLSNLKSKINGDWDWLKYRNL